eukprot:10603168-Alexandrium_andersonii.AAC.1
MTNNVTRLPHKLGNEPGVCVCCAHTPRGATQATYACSAANHHMSNRIGAALRCLHLHTQSEL